jgi:hypothetical protein
VAWAEWVAWAVWVVFNPSPLFTLSFLLQKMPQEIGAFFIFVLILIQGIIFVNLVQVNEIILCYGELSVFY